VGAVVGVGMTQAVCGSSKAAEAQWRLSWKGLEQVLEFPMQTQHFGVGLYKNYERRCDSKTCIGRKQKLERLQR
jgi:hypothetical protein